MYDMMAVAGDDIIWLSRVYREGASAINIYCQPALRYYIIGEMKTLATASAARSVEVY